MTEEHPLGAVCGHDDLAHLPPKERARMRRLRDWLSRPNWKSTESAMLLAGLDPELSFSETEGRWWLPGSDESLHSDEIADRLERARGLRLPLLTPEEAIVAALAKKHRIPWLDAARADPDCQSLLPRELQTAPPAERPIQISNRAKARGRWEADDKQVLMKGAGRAEFDRLRAAGFAGCTREDGFPIIIEVARAVLEAIRKIEPDPVLHPVPRTAERYVKKWLAEDGPDTAGALSDNAGAYMAK